MLVDSPLLSALDRWAETHGAEPAAVEEFSRIIMTAKRRCYPTNVVLEIGSHRGDSLRIWMEEFQPTLTIGVEMEDSERTRDGLAPLLDAAVIILGDSTSRETYKAVQHALDGLPVDFLYIDGDHAHATCSRDWLTYGNLVRPGGLVVFDDLATEPGVRKLADLIEPHWRTETLKGDGDSGGKLLVYV